MSPWFTFRARGQRAAQVVSRVWILLTIGVAWTALPIGAITTTAATDATGAADATLTAVPAPEDSLRVYTMTTVEVSAERVEIGVTETPLAKDSAHSIFQHHGFNLIQRGNPLTGDLQAAGFIRGDIAVTIDGERYPNACPNRMDPPTTRVNPLEIAAVNLSKTSTSPRASLGGVVDFHRRSVQRQTTVRGGVTGTAGSVASADVAFSIDTHDYRFTGRELGGEPVQRGIAGRHRFEKGYFLEEIDLPCLFEVVHRFDD
jgi:hypothetical protein